MGSRVPGVACLLTALFALPGTAGAQTAAFPRGVLVDPVVSPSDPSQRYVVYVPTGLDERKPAPILFIMDYRGRGRVAAALFQPAAERLGWIIASSYNTASDGAGEPNVVAVKTMWRDVHAVFTIDDDRMYLAGLSGTARMATLIAERSGVRFRGVIGAAAGFHPDVQPSKTTPFLYFGTAGTIDYNYWEMRGLEGRLTRAGVTHRIAFFEGPHGWMPPELAGAALYWMELHAMQEGARAMDRALVDERWTRDLDRVRTLESGGLQWEASRLLASMANDYAGLRTDADVIEMNRQATALGATPAASAQAKLQDREAREHERRLTRALAVLADAFPADAVEPREMPAATVRNLDIAVLRRTAASGDTEAALAAARVLAELNVQTGFYLPSEALRLGDDQRAAFYLAVAEAIDPNDGYAWYLRGAVAARAGRPRAAIDALTKAVALGFRTVAAVEHDRSFDPIRRRAEFVSLLQRMRAMPTDQ